MDCLVCNTRSAVDSCVVCHALLCETCGTKCVMCGGVACPQHLHTTHSGKTLCVPCQERRRAAHKAHHGEQVSSSETDVAPEQAMEEAERPILVASVRQPPPPWKMSLYIGCAAVAMALLLFVIPSLRRFALPWGGFFPTPYLLLIAPVIALLWGAFGMMSSESNEDRKRCLIGIGAAILSGVLLIVAAATDPARAAEDAALRAQSEREKMTPQQLEKWRQEQLKKYKK